MRSHHLLLISGLIFCQLLQAKDALIPIDELEPKQLFELAQAAYERNDCEATNTYLVKYLAKAKPGSRQRKRILNAMGWCSLYLREGGRYSAVSGCCDPNFESEVRFEENDFGKSMFDYKDALR